MYICTGCSIPPEIIHVQRPQVTTERDEMFHSEECPIISTDYTPCKNGVLAAFGCKAVKQADPLLGGLQPAYPLVVCAAKDGEVPWAGVYGIGCLLPHVVSYIIWKDETFVQIDSLETLQALYAPITSPIEALSYALAATGLSAYYDLEILPHHKYFVDTLQETSVKAVSNGYLINLYHYQICGCGPHDTLMFDIHVATDGVVTWQNEYTVFTNLSDMRCVD
jgi:hypothetical protein